MIFNEKRVLEWRPKAPEIDPRTSWDPLRPTKGAQGGPRHLPELILDCFFIFFHYFGINVGWLSYILGPIVGAGEVYFGGLHCVNLF